MDILWCYSQCLLDITAILDALLPLVYKPFRTKQWSILYLWLSVSSFSFEIMLSIPWVHLEPVLWLIPYSPLIPYSRCRQPTHLLLRCFSSWQREMYFSGWPLQW